MTLKARRLARANAKLNKMPEAVEGETITVSPIKPIVEPEPVIEQPQVQKDAREIGKIVRSYVRDVSNDDTSIYANAKTIKGKIVVTVDSTNGDFGRIPHAVEGLAELAKKYNFDFNCL